VQSFMQLRYKCIYFFSLISINNMNLLCNASDKPCEWWRSTMNFVLCEWSVFYECTDLLMLNCNFKYDYSLQLTLQYHCETHCIKIAAYNTNLLSILICFSCLMFVASFRDSFWSSVQWFISEHFDWLVY
jgi:hypothetical protein